MPRPIFTAYDKRTGEKCGHNHYNIKNAVRCAFANKHWELPCVNKTVDGRIEDYTDQELLSARFEIVAQEEKKGNRMEYEACRRCHE